MYTVSIIILILSIQSGHSLPILKENYQTLENENPVTTVTITETIFVNENNSKYNNVQHFKEKEENSDILATNENFTTEPLVSNDNQTYEIMARNEPVRPGMTVISYAVEIEPNGGNQFSGRATVQVVIDDANTRDEPVIFHIEDITVTSVMFGLLTINNLQPARIEFDDGQLLIFTNVEASTYYFLIEYVGVISNSGSGLYRGFYDNGASSYLAMNLYPTHARRVFPCVDEPNHTAALSLTVVNNNVYREIVSNAINEGDTNVARFSPLSTATYLWGFVAHDFQNVNIPGDRMRLYGRQTLGSVQHSYASIMTQALFTQLNEYTQKPYFEIDANAEEWLQIFALPDITKDWMSLSAIGIWEPHIMMNEVHAVSHQKTALISMATAYSRQWFGYVVFPENWRHSWITKGMQVHIAYEVANQADPEIDMNALFISEVIYESMYYDAYEDNLPLESGEDLFDVNQIREHINGVVKLKAPALIRMLQLALGENADFIRSAAVSLLNGRPLQTVNPLQFYDAINDAWLGNGGPLIEDVGVFLDPWLTNAGYPVLNIATSTSGNTVIITQEKFGYMNTDDTNTDEVIFNVPLTFTTRINPNFDNIHPVRMLESSGLSFSVFLDEEDWIIFNIQGNGYYRVNYDLELWERLIWSLEDPEQRSVIHPLNRAQLVDDALNLARAGRLDYDTAFRVVLTMEHETEYVVWKAFIRNMDFLRKRLVALDEEEYDFDIYMRMVRRSIVAVERDIGFSPDPLINEDSMVSLTRGLVMEHACRSLYQPCIAAAIDWFYDSSGGEPSINPNIPSDLRPAVFCTVVREGDDAVRNLLWEQYENENVHWERIVILKALACSQDDGFILSYLQETILSNTRFPTEERSIIFEAVAESSRDNANLAFRFLQSNVMSVLSMYGGPDKLEEAIEILVENLADFELTNDFVNWVTSVLTNLDESREIALRASNHALENLVFNDLHLEAVYEWIDENSAAGVTVSMVLLSVGLLAVFLNF